MEEREKSSALYRTGGFSGFALGAAYVIITLLYLFAGIFTGNSSHKLEHLAEHSAALWLILALSVLTDLLFIPLIVSLYTIFKNTNRSLALLGSVLMVVFIVLDLIITWPSYCELIVNAKEFIITIAQRTKVTF